nr:CBN-SRU-33 protein [Haemonchus contortus]
MTIPRTELLAILISTRLAQYLVKHLNLFFSIIRIFSDSLIALHWIHAVKSYKVFIEIRVDAIRRIIAEFGAQNIADKFHYVASGNNPADCATRGLATKEAKSHIWWTGPQFLYDPPDQWPNATIDFTIPPQGEEVQLKQEEVHVLRGANFTSVSLFMVFEKELEAVRAREEIEKKRLAAEKAIRIEKLKRKIRSKKRLIEKAARLQRKRLRGQKREKLRRERKSRHSLLKKAIRDAKAIQKAAAAAGKVVVVDKELKRQWKAAQEAASRRREEKARRRAEHETRKEARRAKRDKKRGRKRRDPNKASSASKKTKDNTLIAVASTISAGATVAGGAIVGTDGRTAVMAMFSYLSPSISYFLVRFSCAATDDKD